MNSDMPSFTCPECGATSYHPDDFRHGYCGRCHAFTGVPEPWIVAHARRHPGHTTEETTEHPGRCLTCGDTSPAYLIQVTR